MKDVKITIAGSAKDQVASIGNILIDTALAQGCAVFAWQENGPKHIGRKNYYHIEISDRPLDGPFSRADVLVDLGSAGQWAITIPDDIDSSGMKPLPANDRLENHPITTQISANAELLGAVSVAIGMDFYTLTHQLTRHFATVHNDCASGVQAAAKRGHAIASGKIRNIPKRRLPVGKQRYIGITGNDAIAMGAAYAGCRFIYSCPTTPPDRMVTFFEKQESRFGKFARQIEHFATPINPFNSDGIKIADNTKSGLRRKRFEWSADDMFFECLADTPVVIVFGWRLGMARNKDAKNHTVDYLSEVCTGKGKTSGIVLIPKSAEDAFYKTILSFQLADIHQAPVIIAADPMVAESLSCIGEIDPVRQTLFSYLSDPEKIKCRFENINIPLAP
jgi:2-oxoglutarate ferredoxin oxidoreductase subunit alpha